MFFMKEREKLKFRPTVAGKSSSELIERFSEEGWRIHIDRDLDPSRTTAPHEETGDMGLVFNVHVINLFFISRKSLSGLK